MDQIVRRNRFHLLCAALFTHIPLEIILHIVYKVFVCFPQELPPPWEYGTLASDGSTIFENVIPTQCKNLTKGGYVFLQNTPCKIVQIAFSVTKHRFSKPKAHIMGIDIFKFKPEG